MIGIIKSTILIKVFYQKLEQLNRLANPVFPKFKKLKYVDDTLQNSLAKYIQELSLWKNNLFKIKPIVKKIYPNFIVRFSSAVTVEWFRMS